MRGVTETFSLLAGEIQFQPALPMRGVTCPHIEAGLKFHISTRTPHAGSDFVTAYARQLIIISTRTPHAGSDLTACFTIVLKDLISTRTPHAGSDVFMKSFIAHFLFQPALPMRGVTAIFCTTLRLSHNIRGIP